MQTTNSPSAKPARQTVDVPDAARMLGVSERTIYLLTQSGQIPHKRVAGRILYPIDALRRFVNDTDPPTVSPKKQSDRS